MYICIVAALVLLAGLMSGLTLGLMSMDVLDMEVKKIHGVCIHICIVQQCNESVARACPVVRGILPRHSCRLARSEHLLQHFIITLARCSEASSPFGICAGFESQRIRSGESLGT